MTTEQSARTPYIRDEERLAKVADLALARETLAALAAKYGRATG